MQGKRALLALALGGLLVIGLVLLVGRAAGFAKVMDVLQDASPWWLGICFAAVVGEYVGYVVAFRGTARYGGGPDLDWRSSTIVVFASLGATRVLAAAGAGGLALNYWVFRKAGLTREESVVRVLALNTLLYALFGFGALGAAVALLLGIGGDAPWAMTLPWLALVPACTAAALWVSSPARGDRFGPSRAAGKLRKLFSASVAGVVLVRRMCARDVGAPGTVAGAAAYWAGDIVCLWAGLKAFGGSLSIPAVVLAYFIGYAANLLPLPTGGVGGVDAAMTFALKGLGVPLEIALLAVVAYRLFSFWLTTIPGAGALAALPRVGRDLSGAVALQSRAAP